MRDQARSIRYRVQSPEGIIATVYFQSSLRNFNMWVLAIRSITYFLRALDPLSWDPDGSDPVQSHPSLLHVHHELLSTDSSHLPISNGKLCYCCWTEERWVRTCFALQPHLSPNTGRKDDKASGSTMRPIESQDRRSTVLVLLDSDIDAPCPYKHSGQAACFYIL